MRGQAATVSAAAVIAEPPTAPAESPAVAGELQLGIEVAGADHRHRP